MNLPRPPRRHPRRGPGLHRPLTAAPETPQEVLERAPDSDVSRETSEEELAPVAFLDELAEASAGRYVAGGQVPEVEDPPPPLHRAQILKLEAETAIWARQVRLGGPQPDDTLLYAAPRPSVPVPPARSAAADEVTEVTPELAAAVLGDDRPPVLPPSVDPAPAPAPPVPGPAPASGRRVSDWTSRHDPRSLEYGVRRRLARAVPLQDVSLVAGPVLDQGTVPPLSMSEASACVGMALTAASNVLTIREHGEIGTGYALLHEDAARGLYSLAQRRDQRYGEDYAGTSVLGGLKAGQELGLWDSYLWALGGTKDIAQVLLQLGVAVVVGVPWSTDLENPDADGVITPGGDDAGGHALAVVGLRIQVGRRPGPWFELQQSRGPAEGKAGRVFIHHRNLARLLAGIGEAGVPLPRER